MVRSPIQFLSNCTIMHPLVNIAISAAKDAGTIIHKYSQQLERVKITEKSKNDFVSEVDLNAEQAIIHAIHKAYPDHSIMAEESGYIERDDEYTWIIDPLDGTKNFLHGFPFYAVSIAVKYKNKIEHGVIYNPINFELFTASRGQGARLNNQRIRVSKENRFDKTLIGTGFPCQSRSEDNSYINTFTSISNKCSGIRRTGSAALDLAFVAAGRLDGFWEFGLKPWDIAAGSILIKEAGGLISNDQGQEDILNSGNVVAGNPKTLKALLQLIKPAMQEET